MSATFLIQVSDKVILCAPSFIILRLFVVFREELNCREAGNAISFTDMSILLVIGDDIGNNTLQKNWLPKKGNLSPNSMVTSLSGLKVAATENLR